MLLTRKVIHRCMDLTEKLLQSTSVDCFLSVWKGFSTMASDPKNQRIFKRIGTHNGVFHCDEALACFMLRQLPEYADAEIIRTRDPEVLDTCDILVDVGGVYKPEIKRFDHHQHTFNETFSTALPNLSKKHHIKLSSAGLVYVHFGMEILTEILKKMDIVETPQCMLKTFLQVYEGFVQELDAIDNGIPMYTDGHPQYSINSHLGARVHKLNPKWNTQVEQSSDKLFQKAMDLVGKEFVEKVVEVVTVWWPARELVMNAILNRKDVYPTGEIIELKRSCPWKEHLLSLEEELGIVGEIKFCLFHDQTSSWRIQGIPLQPDSFICRVFLHKNWRGVRDEELEKISGIEGTIFCHTTGFIGGNKTRDGALEMAIKSLKSSANDKD